MKINLFHLMLLIIILSIAGITGVVYVFVASNAYFSPLAPQQLGDGWVSANTYVSDEIIIATAWTNLNTVQFSGSGIIPVLNIRIDPLGVSRDGILEVRVNGIFLGMVRINDTGVPVDFVITSCCSYPLIVGGEENAIEMKSRGFIGVFRYTMTIPGV